MIRGTVSIVNSLAIENTETDHRYALTDNIT
jgi:hypothetical protein